MDKQRPNKLISAETAISRVEKELSRYGNRKINTSWLEIQDKVECNGFDSVSDRDWRSFFSAYFVGAAMAINLRSR